MTKENPKFEEMKKIRDEIMELKESPLYIERVENGYFPVIGAGSHDANIMFIGEAPGKNEAKTGRPFCGASGRILDELLQTIKTKRDDVYITNIVKDRPTGNRDPRPEEIEIYSPFLDRQIETIQPKVIATLGRFSMQYIMKKFGLEKDLDIISKNHGKIFEAKASYGKIKIIPLYHPAVAIYSRTQLPQLKQDFELLKEYNS
ncbi:MAG: uracil-DNA glycosylase [Candidatus Paceibacterota bacterium]